MQTRISILVVAALLAGCGGAANNTGSNTSSAATPAASPAAANIVNKAPEPAVSDQTEWPVSLILARGLSVTFSRVATVSGITNAKQTQRVDIATDASTYSSSPWSVQYPGPAENRNTTITPFWRMVKGRFEWGGYSDATSTGLVECQTLSDISALPYYAKTGDRFALGACTAGKANDAVAGPIGGRAIWTVEVRPSLVAGKVLVCMQGMCYRGDHDGNIDASITPWEAETAVTANPATATNWPVSLIVARGLSTAFEQCFPQTLADGTILPCFASISQRADINERGGETSQVRQGGGVGGTRTYWHMDSGRVVWDGFAGGNNGGGTSCRATAYIEPLPYYARVGQSAPMGQCQASFLPPATPPVYKTYYASWKVAPSVLPGMIQVCLMGAEFAELCFRANQAGEIDASKLPWEIETAAPEAVPLPAPTPTPAPVPAPVPDLAQWPVSLILARGYSAYFKQCFANASGTDPCISFAEHRTSINPTGGETSSTNSSLLGGRSIRWEMQNGHLVVTGWAAVGNVSRTSCTQVKARVLTPYYAVIGESGSSSTLECTYAGPFPPITPLEWKEDWSVLASKKAGHVLVCGVFGCYRADQSGNLDMSKSPFVAE